MLIGAYYYPWYRERWLHRTVRQSDPPMIGEYDNTVYGETLSSHMSTLQTARVDFISVSYEGRDYGYILDAAQDAGVKVTYFYESLRHAQKGLVRPSALPEIIKELHDVRNEMENECWLRVDGKPVLMIYVTRCFTDPKMFSAIRKEMGDVFLVGDELFWGDISPERLSSFDAVTSYNLYVKKRISSGSPEEVAKSYLADAHVRMASHTDQCKKVGIPVWGCAMPGYNDSGVRPQKQHPPVDRLDGKFFKQSLSNAKAESSGAMMICSFNEWYEDTQIEPAASYGNLYIDMIKDFK